MGRGIEYELLRFRTRDGDETTRLSGCAIHSRARGSPPPKLHALRSGSTTGASRTAIRRRWWPGSSCVIRIGRWARYVSAARLCLTSRSRRRGALGAGMCPMSMARVADASALRSSRRSRRATWCRQARSAGGTACRVVVDDGDREGSRAVGGAVRLRHHDRAPSAVRPRRRAMASSWPSAATDAAPASTPASSSGELARLMLSFGARERDQPRRRRVGDARAPRASAQPPVFNYDQPAPSRGRGHRAAVRPGARRSCRPQPARWSA